MAKKEEVKPDPISVSLDTLDDWKNLLAFVDAGIKAIGYNLSEDESTYETGGRLLRIIQKQL